MWSFKEDDWIAEVDILENFSDQHREGYTLKVVRTVQESSMRPPRPVGYIFTCWKERNPNTIYTPALWQLKLGENHSDSSPSRGGEARQWLLRAILMTTGLVILFGLRRRIPGSF